ncbi:trehalose-phosphatase [Nonomuraea fuscirosea]|uniref:trehalose-phosphatase n=1 Tax=Nonomuraea fuscirosea TaxID=1291556 RepID=UPI00340FA9C6
MSPLRAFNDAVSSAVRQSASTGFFFDFDGTLAPIMNDPDAVLPVPGVVDRLRRLTRLVGYVAIISARPVEFLRERFAGASDLHLFGLYGLQTIVGGQVRTDKEAAPWAPVIRRLVAEALAELPAEILVEDKSLAMALHYRRAPALREVVERWAAAKAAELGVAEQYGRMVVELKPPVARDKGTVVARTIAPLTGAWYFGDDISDERAFDALRVRRERDPAFAGFTVAVANGETGKELARDADYSINSPEDMPALLDAVLNAFPRI